MKYVGNCKNFLGKRKIDTKGNPYYYRSRRCAYSTFDKEETNCPKCLSALFWEPTTRFENHKVRYKDQGKKL